MDGASVSSQRISDFGVSILVTTGEGGGRELRELFPPPTTPLILFALPQFPRVQNAGTLATQASLEQKYTPRAERETISNAKIKLASVSITTNES